MASSSTTVAHSTTPTTGVLNSPAAAGKRRRSEAMADDVSPAEPADGQTDEDVIARGRAMDVCETTRPLEPTPDAYDLASIDSTPTTAMALFA